MSRPVITVRRWLFSVLAVSVSALAASVSIAASASESAPEFTIDFELAVEAIFFPQSPQFTGQLNSTQLSSVAEAELYLGFGEGKHEIVAQPFYRYDGADDARSHFDLREGFYRYTSDNDFSILVGRSKVFWGTTESVHLVDIINQTDLVEDSDEEDKLGQSMLSVTLSKPWGNLELFVLPEFRERTFPGVAGRGRFELPVSRRSVFSREGGRAAIDLAIRYLVYVGNWDVGVSVFHGTSREPRFGANSDSIRLSAIYDEITQYGVELQRTAGALLLKNESIYRKTDLDEFFATATGFEYTLYDLLGFGWDVGLVSEYLYDNRADELRSGTFDFETPTPVTAFQNDVFGGFRVALNDTQDTSLLVGLVTDLDDYSKVAFLEFETLLGQSWLLDLEATWFTAIAPGNLLESTSRDSGITVNLTRHF